MRKILLTILIYIFSFAFCLSDEIVISPNQLPTNIKSFVSKYFPNTNIMYAEIDYNEYSIRLNCGTKIEFDKNGYWKEIKAYQNFPIAILPAPFIETFKKTNPNAFIIKAEKTWNGFEIKTSNFIEIYIDNQGKILKQKFDD